MTEMNEIMRMIDELEQFVVPLPRDVHDVRNVNQFANDHIQKALEHLRHAQRNLERLETM